MKKIFLVTAGFCCLVILQNCSSSKKAAKTPVVSFSKDVMPVMQASCTPCHFPSAGRKEPLNTYDAVKNHIADIIVRIKLPQSDARFMPWKNKKPPLSDSLINVFVEWQKQNMSE